MFFEGILNLFFMLALHLDNKGVFPPPLKAAEEKKCIEDIKNGDMKAKEKLIRHNLRLVAHIIKKYYSAETENDELISVGTVGLIKAINTFDADKGVRLATYASRCIENEILMFFRSQKKTALDVSLDEPIETDSEGNPLTLMDILPQEDTIVDDISLKNNIRKLRDFIEEIDNPREKNVIIMRYGLDGSRARTQNEIAEIYGISRSYVSRIETKALRKLRRKFESEKI